MIRFSYLILITAMLLSYGCCKDVGSYPTWLHDFDKLRAIQVSSFMGKGKTLSHGMHIKCSKDAGGLLLTATCPGNNKGSMTVSHESIIYENPRRSTESCLLVQSRYGDSNLKVLDMSKEPAVIHNVSTLLGEYINDQYWFYPHSVLGGLLLATQHKTDKDGRSRYIVINIYKLEHVVTTDWIQSDFVNYLGSDKLQERK